MQHEIAAHKHDMFLIKRTPLTQVSTEREGKEPSPRGNVCRRPCERRESIRRGRWRGPEEGNHPGERDVQFAPQPSTTT